MKRNWKTDNTEPPAGRPYPPNSPGRTRKTRVYPALCGEELEVGSYPTPSPERPYPRNGRGRYGGTRVYVPLRGEELEDL